jgi:hypothetical protein
LTTFDLKVSGYIRAAPQPGVAQAPLTPELFLEKIVESNATMVLCVPSFLEVSLILPSIGFAGVDMASGLVY